LKQLALQQSALPAQKLPLGVHAVAEQ